jgi:hypothetical protein
VTEGVSSTRSSNFSGSYDEILASSVSAFQEKYNKLWHAPAFFEGNEESFTDKLFHKFLQKKGIERKLELGQEWFYFNGEPFNNTSLSFQAAILP